MYNTSVSLNDETKILLDNIAKFKDKSPNALMKKAIERYVEEEKKEMQWFKNRLETVRKEEAAGEVMSLDEAFNKLVFTA